MIYGAEAAIATNKIAQAIKASGVIVQLEPNEFLKILQKERELIIVHATGGVFKSNYQYLTSYKGLAFFTKSPDPLNISSSYEVIIANKIWVPTW
jgi:hypothetical protein